MAAATYRKEKLEKFVKRLLIQATFYEEIEENVGVSEVMKNWAQGKKEGLQYAAELIKEEFVLE